MYVKIHQEGVEAAWSGKTEATCPHTGKLKEVWLQGWRLAREAIQRTQHGKTKSK